MRTIIRAIFIILLCAGCRTTHNAHQLSVSKTIYGDTYDRVSGEKLIGTLIYNLTQDRMTASDTIGRFRLIANIGDSIRFKYVGMKDTLIVVSYTTPSYLQVGIDTAYMPLIDKGVFRRKHISQTDYKPFQTDNGDDFVRFNRYRIVDKKGKIGYADQCGYIVIEPKYVCAFPFDKGKAKVADTGILKEVDGSGGEYHYWESDGWYYIDPYGERLTK